MKLYHGTISTYVPSIKREGLKPNPKAAFQLLVPNADTPNLREAEGGYFVFVSAIPDTAINFAEFRADYAKTPKGQYVSGDWIADNSEMQKLTGRMIPNAKPALIVLDIPSSDVPNLFEYDPNSPDSTVAFRTSKTIAPKYIQAIQVFDKGQYGDLV